MDPSASSDQIPEKTWTSDEFLDLCRIVKDTDYMSDAKTAEIVNRTVAVAKATAELDTTTDEWHETLIEPQDTDRSKLMEIWKIRMNRTEDFTREEADLIWRKWKGSPLTWTRADRHMFMVDEDLDALVPEDTTEREDQAAILKVIMPFRDPAKPLWISGWGVDDRMKMMRDAVADMPGLHDMLCRLDEDSLDSDSGDAAKKVDEEMEVEVEEDE